ncbi:hypothetical protein [Trichormus variabilis]|uniref:Uncharacterized protein n=1 Tax=Trichormus variabilis SAG 1403-4b TaxID=447716 RepID=A0A3S1BVM7_ANAVA|nr:hypothetical protein [Trichormus variabilis]MBD2629911.1 hypothetical protein [Trichormus variabilis FACHB-164]RUS92284.1 hypothetical protein DSM107003_51460 [Trichormus variabilis SAG 1403-4b]
MNLAQFDIKYSRYIKIQDNIAIWVENGEISYFSCELPLAQNGDRIEVGKVFETDWTEAPFTVTTMQLINRRWYISGEVDNYTEDEVTPFNLLRCL